MKKLVIFFLFCQLFATAGIYAQSVPFYGGSPVTTQASLQNLIDIIPDFIPVIIVVENDIALTSTVTIPQRKCPVIVSNQAYKLTVSGNYRHFSTMSSGNTNNERGLTIGGSLILTRADGYSGNGGGVYIGSNTHTFTLEDNAKIINNSYSGVNPQGGGVYIVNGKFIMNGGEISGNKAADMDGGGVYVIGGLFSMFGGKITGNTAASSGGGVSIGLGGAFTMNGGIISGNTTPNGGGGVDIINGVFTMNGGIISGNTALNSDGGGVHLSRTTGSAQIIMNNGEISNNKATRNGGGIYASYFTDLTISSNVVFTGNSAEIAHNYGAENKGANHTLTAAQTGISGVSGNIQNILWATTSIPGTHLLNNYDIAYRGGNPIYETIGGTTGPLTWQIEDGVLTISGNGAMPEYVNSITAPWFDYRDIIISVIINEGVTTIGTQAFDRCDAMTSISIPNTVLSIGSNSFLGCTKLTSLKIPASVTSIQALFKQNCFDLTSIEVDAANKTFYSENGVLFSKDMTKLVAFPPGKSGFYTIPSSVETIRNAAFSPCYGLTSITIPPSVKTIETSAFRSCRGLTTIILPASVTTIGEMAFEFCRNLSEIVNTRSTPITINNNVFNGVDFDACILKVPAASVDDYRQAAGWMQFKNIVALETGITIELDHQEICLLTGTTTMLTATVTGGDIVTWHSSNETVATVNKTGTITAFKTGTTVITANAGQEEATCIVNVIQLGNSTIEGTVNNAGTGNVRVNLYVKLPESDTKKGIIGGYVLLATTVPNGNSEYKFENLPEGSYKVEVEMDDYEPGVTKELPLSENESLSDINFTVDVASLKIIPDDNITIPTGTVETWHAASLQIYPNPFTDVLHINVETGRAPSSRMQIINTAGAIVHTQTIANPDETIHLGHLPTGLYIIRIENNGMVKTEKMIKIQ